MDSPTSKFRSWRRRALSVRLPRLHARNKKDDNDNENDADNIHDDIFRPTSSHTGEARHIDPEYSPLSTPQPATYNNDDSPTTLPLPPPYDYQPPGSPSSSTYSSASGSSFDSVSHASSEEQQQQQQAGVPASFHASVTEARARAAREAEYRAVTAGARRHIKDAGSFAEPHAYRPLCIDQEIRLVRLLAAPTHEPVAVRMFHVILDDPSTRYEALSYTWGDQENKVSVDVDGRDFQVTRNLNTALRYLRREEEDVVMWVDALCINQEDHQEKAGQLALMQDIYRNADNVNVWLGPEADDSDLIMGVFEERGSQFYANYDEPNTEEYEQRSENLRSYLLLESEGRMRRSLEAFMEREYWSRIWVVQEVFCARYATVICGRRATAWNYVATIIEAFLTAPSLPLAGSWDFPPKEMPPPTGDTQVSRLKTIAHLAECRLSPMEERGPVWLLNLLLRLRHFKSTDPKDKIFSILGLLNPELFLAAELVTPVLAIDYDLSFRDISTRLFQLCLFAPRPENREQATTTTDPIGSLNILCASRPDHHHDPTFPTWLPDFSQDDTTTPWPTHPSQRSGCCPCAAAVFSSPTTPSTLSVHACAIAPLLPARLTPSTDDPLATDTLTLFARIRAFIALAPHSEKDFWSTLTLSHPPTAAPALLAFFARASSRPASLSLTTQLALLEAGVAARNASALAYLDAFRAAAYGRRFAVFAFRGDEARGGMVPAGARAGDVLFLLGDCDYLVLLRKAGEGEGLGRVVEVEEGQEEEEGHDHHYEGPWEVVGPCWVPGMRVWPEGGEGKGAVRDLEGLMGAVERIEIC